MRALLAIILVAAGLWAGYWVIGSRTTHSAFEGWFDARRAEGWVAETSSLGVQGFPNRFDVVFEDVILADPATGLAWEAPRFQINALSYRPNHVIAVWPDEQRIATPEEKFRIESRDMRASLVIAPDAALAPRRMTLTADFLRVTSETRPGETTALSTLSLAAERQEGTTYRFGLRAEGLTLAAPARTRLDPEGRLPDRISGFTADVTATFDKPWDRTAIERARPQPTHLSVRLAEGRWGDLLLQAAGEVDVTPDGWPDGEITLKARNWREIVTILRSAGALPESLASSVENGLGMMARLKGNPDTLDIPLGFGGGRMWLGPVPLGSAPRLRLR
ncbi:DUF2125 domain-containing protein [Roseovarius sp. A46]|uniref:DUF2125 domain-containing protein n=1 Tax=Roseovarius sp. A46 TaxID=2109331 RepID=UPI001013223D|nr:DUF2125 domain-containing protein [Roseovarius sp. A46]RXV66291.1 DUF2125 domain-containing protein [Roseovarius sp. A46]